MITYAILFYSLLTINILILIFGSKEKKPIYFQVTKEHREGDILPTEGSSIIMFDKTVTTVETVIPKGCTYKRHQKPDMTGPRLIIGPGSTPMYPKQFWNSVKSINGIEVVN